LQECDPRNIGIGNEFILTLVVPNIQSRLSDEAALVLDKALIWWICSPGGTTVPQHIQDRVKTAYNDAREGGDESENPINKVPLVVTGDEGVVHIDELPHEEHPEAVVCSGDATGRSAGRLTISGNGTRSVREHLIALQSQCFSLRRSLEELSVNRAEDRIISTRKCQTLNENLKRKAIQPARRIVPPAATAIVTDNDSASLSSNPRTLHLLWEEYQHGIGGRKAAKLFTSQERGRLKHNVAERLCGTLFHRLSVLAIHPMMLLIECMRYGVQSSVTTVINRLENILKRRHSTPV
jgi:hypothetical protein